MKNNKNNKSGFTLVELAIVLVIIGLLIGGILVAQSMINTTKIQALGRQIASFDAAVATFGDRFGGLPGDVAAVGTAAGAGTDGDGDADGIIEDTAGTLVEFSGEIGTFWNALSLTGLSTDGQGTNSITYVQATAEADVVIAGATANIPRAKAGSNTAGWVAYGTNATNFYQMVTLASQGAATWVDSTATTAALRPTDALALDSKYDNAIANTGNVQARAVLQVGLGGTVLAGCAAGAAYATATTTTACDPIVRIGIQTGDLK